MSDKRTEAITTLTEHLDHWKRLLSEGVCTKDEGERTINALNFAIESIKVDRAYDLAYEKVDFIEIPEGATNGEVAMQLFGNKGECVKVCTYNDKLIGVKVIKDWWNSPYRKEQE